MESVLLDGTSLAEPLKLLAGDTLPSALNVSSLALLLEAVILHDQLTFLETSSDESPLDEMAKEWSGVARIERAAPSLIVTRYLASEIVGLGDLGADDEVPPGGYGGSLYDRAETHLKELMANHHKEADGLVRHLLGLQTHYETHLRPQRETVQERMKHFIESEAFPEQPTDEIECYVGADGVSTAWSDFIDRFDAARHTSAWRVGVLGRSEIANRFENALVARAHLYVMASQVLGIPYRPDALKAPVCWTYFKVAPLKDMGQAERLLSMAASAAQVQVDRANEFLSKPAFVRVPLFLSTILASSASRHEIVDRTLEIRDSKEAQRFRQHMRELGQLTDAGEIDKVCRSATRFGQMLSDQYSNGTGDGLNTVLSLGTSASKATLLPGAGTAIGLAGTSAKAARGIHGGISQAWYRRKVSLVSTAIGRSRKVRPLQPELRRLFGEGLNRDETQYFEMMTRQRRFGTNMDATPWLT